MKKRFMSILLILCMVLPLLPTVSVNATSTTDSKANTAAAHGRLKDGGYKIYSMVGQYVSTDTYPSLRSVEIAFPGYFKVFYVENKGNNQITLKIENTYSSTGYSYIGIDSSVKSGVELKVIDDPFLWETYAESDTELLFSLRPSTNNTLYANASGKSSSPRTKIILSSGSDLNAPKHGEFRFEPIEEPVKTPVASDYAFANLTQTQGSVTPVRIEAGGKTSPGAITIKYNGSTTLPKKAGSYTVTFDVAAEPPAWKGAKGLKAGTLVIAPKPTTAAPVGQLIKMGGMDWRVLDVQGGKALVLSEMVIASRQFSEDISVLNSWAKSPLRSYLNGDFYNKTFTKAEKSRIVSTTLKNNINPEYSLTLGTDTKDKLFLLSAEELARYFKDDSSRIAYADRSAPGIVNTAVNAFELNPYDGIYQRYTAWHWWLRTPEPTGNGDRGVLYVNLGGEVSRADIDWEIGVRPAMWIKIDGDGFKKYKPISFTKEPNYFTKEDMLTAIASDIVYKFTGDWVFQFGFGARGPSVAKAEKLGSNAAMPPGYRYSFFVFRMRCWGVLSFDNFDPLEKVTYGQFKDYLTKTMNWFKKYGAGDSKYVTLTKEVLAIAEKKAGISNTKDSATPKKDEIKRLSKEIIYWLEAANALNGVRLLEIPTKTEFKVGEGFDYTGLLVVTGAYGKEKNVNDKLTFTTSGVTLTKGRPFQTAGQKSVTVSYKGETLLTYPITVKK